MRVFAALMFAGVLTGAAHASDHASGTKYVETAKCGSLLGREQNSFTKEQVEFLENANFGKNSAPAEYRREFRRGDEIVATLALRLRREGTFTRRRLLVSATGLPEDEIRSFFERIRADLETFDREAALYPYDASPDEARSTVARTFGLSTGYRHPLTAGEATRFFDVLHSILARCLTDYEIRDAFATERIKEAGIKS